MNLRQSLANSFSARHPNEVAAALESRPADEVARVLERLPRGAAAAVLTRMSPGISAGSLGQIDADTAAGIVAELGTDEAVPILRRVPADTRDAIVRAMPPEVADAVRAVMNFPSGTAGAMMDPRVAALPTDMEVDDAIKAVRREAEYAHEILYVVDRERRLAGVVHLPELLLAKPKERLEAVMRETRHQLSPTVDRHAVAQHAGWRDGHSLPVVDRNGRLLGAIHIGAVRELQDELRERQTGSGDTTVRALGDLFWTGVGGLIDAMTAAVAPSPAQGVDWRPPQSRVGESGERGTSDATKRSGNGEE